MRRIVRELMIPLRMRPCRRWPSPGISHDRTPISQGFILYTSSPLRSAAVSSYVIGRCPLCGLNGSHLTIFERLKTSLLASGNQTIYVRQIDGPQPVPNAPELTFNYRT